jgi:hypothetical protein
MLVAMKLEGSCHCRAVRFTVEAMSPAPFMHCHCSICRKTAGSGGFGINLGASMPTLRVRGEKNLGTYHAVMREPGKRATRSKAERRFCLKCGSPLWLFDPRWPELVHPHASAIDTPLPKPPEVVEADLHDAPAWVDVPTGKGHRHEPRWPKESLEDWHRRHGLLGRVGKSGKGGKAG